MTTTDCTTDYGEYERYSDDRLFHGAGLKIDRSVYYKGDCDISDLITKSAKEVESLRDHQRISSSSYTKTAFRRIVSNVPFNEQLRIYHCRSAGHCT